MIDWLTLWTDASNLSPETRAALVADQDRIVRYSPKDGSIRWDSPARESIRSDSHQITAQLGSRLTLQGSPARVRHPNNVFGSGDIRECAADMIGFLSQLRGVGLPPLEQWKATRVDVTYNYLLESPSAVRQVLAELSLAEGGSAYSAHVGR